MQGTCAKKDAVADCSGVDLAHQQWRMVSLVCWNRVSVQLLISILEVLATITRMLYEKLQSESEVRSWVRSASIAGESSDAAEARLEEGESGDDAFNSEILKERLRTFATKKPRRYYVVARGRVPRIYSCRH